MLKDVYKLDKCLINQKLCFSFLGNKSTRTQRVITLFKVEY